MQENLVKKALLGRQATIGCWLVLSSPTVAEALAHCGFNWLLIDQEHAPNDIGNVVHQLRAIDAARAHGALVGAIVRVACNDATLVKHAMDCGAQSVMFPMVETVEQARSAVQAMRYPQGITQDTRDGIRGVASIVRAAHYGLDASYTAQANAQACAIVQIESTQGVANAQAIAQVDGVDCLFIGPADLSASLGHPGNPTHPEVQAAITTVQAAAYQAGKAVGIFAVTAEQARIYRDKGFHLIALHSDVAWLTRGATAALATCQAI